MSETHKPKHIKVTPNIYQTEEDVKANHHFDEARDNEPDEEEYHLL